MGNGGCVEEYTSPIPLNGLYIFVATLVCVFCIAFDLVYGLFIRKKPYLPCKLFSMNAFTLTVLAAAIKISVDHTTPMPKVEDQLSKLTATAMLCTSIGFYMPSLGTMGTSERYGNLAALSVTVITVVVNVCMQLSTGVIFTFTIEHIIVMVCTLILLLLMWSSAIAFRGIKEELWKQYEISKEDSDNNIKDVQTLRKLLVKLHMLNYSSNPQTLLWQTSHHQAFGLLCFLSFATVLQAILRSFALKNMRLCSSTSVSDYKWTIPIIIVAQFVTILAGTISIIYRWISFVAHTDRSAILLNTKMPEQELEYLKLKTLSFKFFSKNLSIVFVVAKDTIMNGLIRTQILLHTCTDVLVALPVYVVKGFLEFIIPFECISNDQNVVVEMSISEPELHSYLFSNRSNIFEFWMTRMMARNMMRWKDASKRDRPTDIIQLISKYSIASKSECTHFINKLEVTWKNMFKSHLNDYEYRVSCVSVLALSGMLRQLMPSSHSESLMKSLKESFEIIYYVDQKTDTPSADDEIRWTSTKDVWAQWENPKHWFRKGYLFDASALMKKKQQVISSYDEVSVSVSVSGIRSAVSLDCRHEAMFETEYSIIFKALQEQEYKSGDDLFDFLEKCYVEMLYFLISDLPLAILKDMNENDPLEIDEGRVEKALMLFFKLELFEDTIKWSWPAEFEPETQENDVHSPAVAPNCGYSEVKATVSNVVDGKVDSSDVSHAAADDDDNDDDAIREIGFNENV